MDEFMDEYGEKDRGKIERTLGADMIFVDCFTLAHFPKYWNLPEKKSVNHDISDSKYGI